MNRNHIMLPNNDPDIIDSTEGNNINRDGNVVTLNQHRTFNAKK